MKSKKLVDDFSTFELLNKEGVIGGKKLSSTFVTGTYTNGAGQTFMDISMGGTIHCDQSDSDWGGQYPVGTELG